MGSSETNVLKEMNVIHLVVLSGFHISLLNKVSNKLFFFISKNNYKIRIILTSIPLMYVYLLGFRISMTRAFLMIFIATINKELFKSKLNRLEIYSITLISLVIWRP